MKTISKPLHAALVTEHACSGALTWVTSATWPSFQAAWDACPRGSWLLWLIGRGVWRKGDPFGTPEHRALIGCLVEIVIMNAQPFWSDRARPSCEAIVAAVLRRYEAGEAITRDAIFSARAAFADAADAAADAFAAADADAFAADAAAAAAASAAADAAAYAATAAAAFADAADAVARADSERASADIVRSHYPEPPAFVLEWLGLKREGT